MANVQILVLSFGFEMEKDGLKLTGMHAAGRNALRDLTS